MPTLEQCAWAAGFMDGEGSIYVRSVHSKAGHPTWRRSYAIAISLGQDDIRPLIVLRALWGGSIAPQRIRANGKCNCAWTLTAKSAASFLADIRPYLQVKGEQADLALEMQSSKKNLGPHHVSESVLAKWKEIKGRISTLNARYPGYYDVSSLQGVR